MFNRDFVYIYVGMSVVCHINCVGGIAWPRACSKSFLGGKDCDTRVIDFDYALEQLYHEEKDTFT